MRASAGAIEKVEVEMGGSLTVSTVEDAEPLGICGSGILDAISALMDTGALDERGRLVSGNPWVVDDEGERAYRLEPSSVRRDLRPDGHRGAGRERQARVR